MDKKKLMATHDSATGEKCKGLLSYLVTPFSKTQSKTISEQYKSGCRYFDIRVKLNKGKFYCAHGLWRTKREAIDILMELNSKSEHVFVEMTYEGGFKNKDKFMEFANHMDEILTHIHFTSFSIKYGEGSNLFKVKYSVLGHGKQKDNPPISAHAKQCFLPLDGRSWHILFPCPWLWKQFYFKNVEFNDEYYSFVDFL